MRINHCARIPPLLSDRFVTETAAKQKPKPEAVMQQGFNTNEKWDEAAQRQRTGSPCQHSCVSIPLSAFRFQHSGSSIPIPAFPFQHSHYYSRAPVQQPFQDIPFSFSQPSPVTGLTLRVRGVQNTTGTRDKGREHRDPKPWIKRSGIQTTPTPGSAGAEAAWNSRALNYYFAP